MPFIWVILAQWKKPQPHEKPLSAEWVFIPIMAAPKSQWRSPEAQEYHRLYKLKLWCHKPTGLRWQCLVKALFTCKACAWAAKPSETHLLVADHIQEHKGQWDLFSDPQNLQCLCQSCHSGDKQSFELTGKKRLKIGVDGWPIED